jgi:hypothetical protein
MVREIGPLSEGDQRGSGAALGTNPLLVPRQGSALARTVAHLPTMAAMHANRSLLQNITPVGAVAAGG